MLPPIHQLLKASPAVAAILGVAPKAYRHGQVPQGTVAPYVTWAVVGGAPELNLSDLPTHDRLQVQVDCYHPDDAGVETLAVAVRDAIEPAAAMTGIVVNQKEPETRLYRIALQFDFLLDR